MGKKQKTNTNLVSDFMEYKSALHQVWVIDMLGKMAEYMTTNADEIKKQMRKEGSANFIHPEAWIQCASDWTEYYKQERGE